MSLKVYNTLIRRKEELVPRDKGKIGLYVCGPTVYNYIHIGNARTYLSFDVIARYLKFRGFDLTYVQNLTDVDDKIINRAKEEKSTPGEVTEKYTAAFQEDMKALGVLPPDVTPKATEHIPEMVSLVEKLIENGYGYEIDGSVYFEVTKFADYGKLAHRTLEDMRAGERVEIDKRKHHPMDFALWKKAKEGEPSWDSPWGKGRPGWHIECSVMSSKYLGMGFDIHGGGRDLIFPHHENEIAQSEAATGTGPFVRYWLHGGMVQMGKEKMAKSVGNIILVRDLLQKYNSNWLRMLFLGTHYRSPVEFTIDKLKGAGRSYERLQNLVFNLNHFVKTAKATSDKELKKDKHFEGKIKEAKDKFVQFMDDDFNAPAALAAVFDLAKEANRFVDEARADLSKKGKLLVGQAADTVKELTGVLGLTVEPRRLVVVVSEGIRVSEEVEVSTAKAMATEIKQRLSSLVKEVSGQEAGAKTAEELVEILLSLREEARAQKDFQRADEIRNKLAELGIEVEDTAHGTRWKLR